MRSLRKMRSAVSFASPRSLVESERGLTLEQSAALLQAIKDYENNKWKVIGQKVGKPAKVCVLFLLSPIVVVCLLSQLVELHRTLATAPWRG
jgi:hypothetical protein